jgi:beta-ketodecanoyl-[acyl-carrier-protein] synthase
MNAKGVLGRLTTDDEAPVVLDEFANSSAGSVIAFQRRRANLARGDRGVICSFGAGNVGG